MSQYVWNMGLLPLLWLLRTSIAMALSLDPFSPNVYWPEATIPLSVNKVTSSKTLASIAFYDLPFVCKPAGGVTKAALSLDEVLRGDRLMSSDVKLKMLSNDACHILCTQQLGEDDIRLAHQLIKQDYKVEWYVDGLPGATSFATHDKTHKYYAAGFRLGQTEADGRTYLNNHFTFVIKYRHSDNHDDTRVILAFEVYPRSIVMTDVDRQSVQSRQGDSCDIAALEESVTTPALALVDEGKRLYNSLNVTYTYSVYFREDLDIHWARRWDLYFYFSNPRIVWWTTAVSAVICLSLATIIGLTLARTLRNEVNKATMPTKADLEFIEDDVAGWKLLRNDVFRAPARPDLLSASVGTGIQVVITIFAVLIRRKIPSLGLFGLLFAGVFGGFQSGKLHKYFTNGQTTSWTRNGLFTAAGIPGVFFISFLVLNCLVWIQGYSAAVPLSTVMELLGMWFGISLPLVMIGAYTGSRKLDNHANVVHVQTIPRQIPRQPFYCRFWSSILVAGALPYAAIGVELYFILNSIKLHQDGYLSFVFSSLSIVAVISILTTIEVSVAMTYLLLRHEDHEWHWRAFSFGAASSLYIFAHATFYFFSRLRYGFLSGLVYFGTTSLFCLLYALIQGTFGYTVSSLLVRKIYASIKED